MLMIADRNSKEIKLVPLPIAAQLLKLRLVVEDRTGVLAEITRFLALRNIDIVSTKCVVLKREELGECEMIVDVGRSGVLDIDIIENELKKLEPVRDVEIIKMV